MNLRKGILITLVVVAVGLAYLYLAMVGPLQSLNIGFGLTQGLADMKFIGSYSMANAVTFLIFVVILVILGLVFFKGKKA